MPKKQMFSILVIGEILFDIFAEQGYENIGGAPFNFAYHIQNILGNVVFISKIGDDALARKALNFLGESRFPVKYIQTDKKYPTGKVNVTLDKESIPTFDIVENTAYDYIEYNDQLDKLLNSTEIDLVYFGSLAQRNDCTRDTLEKILTKTRKALTFMDLNLRAPHYNEEIIELSLHASDILKINEGELEVLSSLYKLTALNTEDKIRKIADNFNISFINLTSGDKGSILYLEDTFHQTKVVPKNIIDTVGAGDAYASILALGLLYKWPAGKILEVASEFALEICQIKGAVPRENDIYLNLLKKHAFLTS
ncbi:PfkB family carbohydrate kinase [Candidatus Margulisiibacteriota bacterium]